MRFLSRGMSSSGRSGRSGAPTTSRAPRAVSMKALRRRSSVRPAVLEKGRAMRAIMSWRPCHSSGDYFQCGGRVFCTMSIAAIRAIHAASRGGIRSAGIACGLRLPTRSSKAAIG